MTEPTVRGVYRLRCLSIEGFPIYVAVTSDGRRIGEREVFPFEDPDEVVAYLDGLLKEHDPITRVA